MHVGLVLVSLAAVGVQMDQNKIWQSEVKQRWKLNRIDATHLLSSQVVQWNKTELTADSTHLELENQSWSNKSSINCYIYTWANQSWKIILSGFFVERGISY